MDNYYSMHDAVEILGITPPTLRKHLKRIGIVAVPLGADHRTRYITSAELEMVRKWLNKETYVFERG